MSSPETPVPSASKPAISGRWWVLAVLTMVYTFNHLDRQVFVTVLEPLKEEMHLSDLVLGMLTGIGFAAVYATLGIPIAYLADRSNRRNIIAVSLLVWSAATAACGLAQNVVHLFLSRIGVGIGEAGGTPPATSMIADVFPAKQRAMALGIYTTGIGFGIMLGYIVGAFVYANFGWRAAFFAAGVPGILLSILLRFTIKEPIRGGAELKTGSADEPAPSLGETMRFMFGQSSYLLMLLGCLFICISANAYVAFTSSHLQRMYDLEPQDVAIPLGLLIGGVGSVGAILLGFVCDRLSDKDLRWRPWIIAVTSAIALPFAFMFLQASTPMEAYMWNVVPNFVGLIYASIAYTAAQELVKVRMRAFSSAFTLFCLTLIGISGGPAITGALSDWFTAQNYDAPLKTALEIVLIFNGLSVIFLALAGINYRKDVARASAVEPETITGSDPHTATAV